MRLKNQRSNNLIEYLILKKKDTPTIPRFGIHRWCILNTFSERKPWNIIESFTIRSGRPSYESFWPVLLWFYYKRMRSALQNYFFLPVISVVWISPTHKTEFHWDSQRIQDCVPVNPLRCIHSMREMPRAVFLYRRQHSTDACLRTRTPTRRTHNIRYTIISTDCKWAFSTCMMDCSFYPRAVSDIYFWVCSTKGNSHMGQHRLF